MTRLSNLSIEHESARRGVEQSGVLYISLLMLLLLLLLR